MVQAILSSLQSFIDAKRDIVPLLWFRADEKVLWFFLIPEFPVLQAELMKVVIHIVRIDAQMGDSRALRLTDVVDEDGYVFPLVNPVQATGLADR
jgi:hypothetical protein